MTLTLTGALRWRLERLVADYPGLNVLLVGPARPAEDVVRLLLEELSDATVVWVTRDDHRDALIDARDAARELYREGADEDAYLELETAVAGVLAASAPGRARTRL